MYPAHKIPEFPSSYQNFAGNIPLFPNISRLDPMLARYSPDNPRIPLIPTLSGSCGSNAVEFRPCDAMAERTIPVHSAQTYLAES
jgi:hypothetical protein